MVRKRLTTAFIIICMVLFIVVFVSLALSSTAQLEEFIAQSVVNDQWEQTTYGYLSPEGSIVAHVLNLWSYEGPRTPFRAWRVEQGRLTEKKPEVFLEATGNDRSRWPPFTFYYDIEYMTPLVAKVEVATLYNRGIILDSRGGYAQTWTAICILGRWTVISKQIDSFWD